MKYYSIWFVLIVFLSVQNSRSFADTILIATNDWTPYNTTDGLGLLDNIVKEAFALVGHDVEYSIQPWKRAYVSVQFGEADLTYPWSYTEERDAEIIFNDSPIIVSRSIFWHRADEAFSWQDYADLERYEIGGMIGYIDTELLESNDIEVTKVQFEVQSLKMLLAGRIDAFAMNEIVGHYIIKDNLTESEKKQITNFQGKPLFESNMHGVFSKTERGAKLAADFERGLKQLIDTGRYDELLLQ